MPQTYEVPTQLLVAISEHLATCPHRQVDSMVQGIAQVVQTAQAKEQKAAEEKIKTQVKAELEKED